MSWDGSGNFLRLFSWVADKAAGLDISSTRMDSDTDNITSNGFGNCLTRDGQGQPTANLPMAGFRHTGVQNAVNRTDYAALGQAQDGLIGWTIAGGTSDAITATYTPARGAPQDGWLYAFRATAANATTTPTFAPDGNTAELITRFGGAAVAFGDIPGNLAESFVRYNAANTRYELLNPAAPQVPRGFLGGLILSNDGVAPNTVLDISAGQCADSTNAALIVLGAFTKSTAGSWAAGSGSNGMGTGLTIANTTWYHVFAIIKAGAADVYFDTSIAAANKPSGTTLFRRIGSFLTDGSAHIIAFTQLNDNFIWGTPVNDVNANNLTNSGATYTLTVPTGLNVQALFNASYSNTGGNGGRVQIYSPSQATAGIGTNTGSNFQLYNEVTSQYEGGQFAVFTNTSAQIKAISSATSGNSFSIWTNGWVDSRGRFA